MEKCFIFLRLSVIVLSCLAVINSAQNRSAVELLYRNLMTNYNKNIRPDEDQRARTVVQTNFFLGSITSLDEVSGTLSVIAYIDMMWTDPRISWNYLDYDKTKQILFPQDEVWKPTLVVTNTVKQMTTLGFSGIMVRYNHKGMALWYSTDYLETICEIDVENFPFDQQKCSIIMIPWSYKDKELRMSVDKKFGVGLTNYTENGAWVVSKTATEKVEKGQITYIHYHLYLKRRSSFFIINLFIPVIVLVFLNCMVFFLPADSGERIGYAMTCLLSITVFLTLVSDNIPKTSKPICVLSFILMLCLILSTVICLLTIVGLRFHFRDDKIHLPSLFRHFVRVTQCNKSWKLRCRSAKGKRNGIRPSIDATCDKMFQTNPSVGSDSSDAKPVVSLVEEDSENGKPKIVQKRFSITSVGDISYYPCNDDIFENESDVSWKDFARAFDIVCLLLCVGAIIIVGTLYVLVVNKKAQL